MSRKLALVIDNPLSELASPELEPLIPEGNYHFAIVTHETAMPFGKPRLVISLRVLDLGEQNGIVLKCWRNLQAVKGKPKNKGGFIPPKRGLFMDDYCRLFPGYNPRRDQISLRPLYDKIIFAQVKTVKTDTQGQELSRQLWYSKVNRLLLLTRELPD